MFTSPARLSEGLREEPSIVNTASIGQNTLHAAFAAIFSSVFMTVDVPEPVRGQAVKQSAEMSSAVEFFATAQSFRERSLESVN